MSLNALETLPKQRAERLPMAGCLAGFGPRRCCLGVSPRLCGGRVLLAALPEPLRVSALRVTPADAALWRRTAPHAGHLEGAALRFPAVHAAYSTAGPLPRMATGHARSHPGRARRHAPPSLPGLADGQERSAALRSTGKDGSHG